VYSTPRIERLGRDGGKQIVVPAFQHELHLLDADGHELARGWPHQQPGKFFHTSPVLIDLDGSDEKHLAWCSTNGDVVIVDGDPLNGGRQLHRIRLPRLRVPKTWFKGMDTEHLQTDDPVALAAARAAGREFQGDMHGATNKNDESDNDDVDDNGDDVDDDGDGDGDGMAAGGARRRLLQTETRTRTRTQQKPHIDASAKPAHPNSKSNNQNGHTSAAAAAAASVHMAAAAGAAAAAAGAGPRAQRGDAARLTPDEGMSAEARRSYGIFAENADEDGDGDGDADRDYADDGGGGDDYLEDDEYADDDDGVDSYDKGYEAKYGNSDDKFVWVDAHCLATPVAADVDGNGTQELIIAVSYFFDAEEYAADPSLYKRLQQDVDIANYVAVSV
jgi:hypothetical protein